MKKVIIALIMCISFAFVNPGLAQEVIEDRSFCNEEISDWDKEKLFQQLYVTVLEGLINSRVPDATADHQDKVLFNSMLYQQEIEKYSFETAESLLLNFTAQERCAWKLKEVQEQPPEQPEEVGPEEEQPEEVEPEQVVASFTYQPGKVGINLYGLKTATSTITAYADGDFLRPIQGLVATIDPRFSSTQFTTLMTDSEGRVVVTIVETGNEYGYSGTRFLNATILIEGKEVKMTGIIQEGHTYPDPSEQVFKYLYVSEDPTIGTNSDGVKTASFRAWAYGEDGIGLPGLEITIGSYSSTIEVPTVTTGNNGFFYIILPEPDDDQFNNFGSFSLSIGDDRVYTGTAWYFDGEAGYLSSAGRNIS